MLPGRQAFFLEAAAINRRVNRLKTRSAEIRQTGFPLKERTPVHLHAIFTTLQRGKPKVEHLPLLFSNKTNKV